MFVLVIALHIIVCVVLIMIVLLQTGKGADIGAVFGGGSGQALFGSAGPAGFLAKITTAVAVLYMVTSLYLAYVSGRSSPSETIMEETKPKTTQEAPAPVSEKPAPPEEGGVETPLGSTQSK
jgi:preprotein translocase subunit SecG